MNAPVVRYMLALTIGCIVSFTAVTTTRAYDANHRWSTNTASFSYASSWPAGSWRDRASDAAESWNNVSTSSWRWTYPSTPSQGDLRLENIDGSGGTFGTTTITYNGGFVTSFRLRVDREELWNVGAIPRNTEVDLESVVVHELGHGAWADHTDGTGPDCTITARPTMCAFIPRGTSFMRSLEQDDRDGISFVYP
ncbi:MAG: matrixin family metalloprotease [Blastochloris sp.]|nr:matrixin family metalloprotease [Blastochloris sp.]